MSETIVAPAAPAASTSAPAAPSAPAAAPASTPAPVSNPVASRAGVPSQVDPSQDRNDYAKAVLAEQMAAFPEVDENPAEVAETPVEVPEAVDPEAPVVEVEVPEKAEEAKPEEVAEEAFELEPAPIVTPEALTQMVTDNPDFGALLEADPRLKGQLYKTAREAAELKPYREIFPDLDSAKTALDHSSTWVDVRETFLGSTTREGTMASLNKIAELSYERDGDGNLVMQNGQPVIGDDFYGFVDNVVGLDMEHSLQDITAKLNAGGYTDQATFDADQQYAIALEIIMNRAKGEAPQAEELTPFQKQKQAELDEREGKLKSTQHQEKVQTRTKFEQGLQVEARTRLETSVKGIMASIKKQGAVLSPFVEETLMKSIPALTVHKIAANPTIQFAMRELQSLPIGDKSKARRLAAIDRAYQQYLPEVAREQLKAAGVQIKANADAKAAKVNGQADHTKKTEPHGSVGHTGGGSGPMTAPAAFDYAKAEWVKANPGRQFDNVAQTKILGRVVQLQVHGR